jgi:type I restriction enzyme S subunit
MPKDLLNGRVSDQDIARIPESLAQTLQKHRLIDGDIIFGRRGDIGRCALITENEYGWLCGTGCLRARLDRQKADPPYVIYFLELDESRAWLQMNAVGQTMLNLSTSILAELPITLPPLPEQRKIAAILSAWDEAITLAERLIDALKRRKQALMQRLLTGEVRFKEFEDEAWGATALGSVATLVNGRAFKPKDWLDQGIPIIRIQNLNGSDEFNYYDQDVEARYYVEPGELLFSWSGSRGTSFGPHIWRGPRGILNQHIFRVINNGAIDKNYLFHALLEITSRIEDRAHGSAGLVHITKPALEKFEIPFPNLDEQIAISGMLDLADLEINVFDQLNDRFREQKRGLMQQLLTGAIRVQPEEEDRGIRDS